jgi:hypothetical protein
MVQINATATVTTTNWYNHCNYVRGMKTDLHDMIESYQCADLIPKMERD